ncbi:MAG: hypothetical protein LBR89_04560 [Holosporales bacterium]|nr:hypothetical protein [Holosporales bacterium]
MFGDTQDASPRACFYFNRNEDSRERTGWDTCITAHLSSAFKVIKAISPISLCKFDTCELSFPNSLPLMFSIYKNLPSLRGSYWESLYTSKNYYGRFITITPQENDDRCAILIKKADKALMSAIHAGKLSSRGVIRLPGAIQAGSSGGVFASANCLCSSILFPLSFIDATFRGKPISSFRTKEIQDVEDEMSWLDGTPNARQMLRLRQNRSSKQSQPPPATPATTEPSIPSRPPTEDDHRKFSRRNDWIKSAEQRDAAR